MPESLYSFLYHATADGLLGAQLGPLAGVRSEPSFGVPQLGVPSSGALGNFDYAPPAGPPTELEIDRNHWKREALRYKQLLMDMLGKEVE